MKQKNLTVNELIKELQKYDGNSKVWIWKERNARETERVTKVAKGTVTKNGDIIIS